MEYTMEGGVIEEDGKFIPTMTLIGEPCDDIITAKWAVKDLKKEIQVSNFVMSEEDESEWELLREKAEQFDEPTPPATEGGE